MKLKEAIKILENHNEWRRNDKVPNDIVMVEPKELGIAIDTVVNEFEKLTIPVVVSAVSKDYTKLYDKVNKGETVPCFVDYKSFNLKKVYRDIASIRKRPDNSIDIGVRGISYGGVSEWHLKDITEFEAFIYECKRLNLEYYT